MELSIIIVNYNVKHFLEQCLLSLFVALEGINSEVIVVDNNSVDGSVSMLREKFSQISLIENQENFGFSRANNQGLKVAKGKYILLLNPDTVLDENSLRTCLQFMESNPDAGAVGLKMIDGKGVYLPESKRALPTPSIAFYKIFGLSHLFPRSKKFNKYYLGQLDNNKIHKVDILTGAFMFIRAEVLEKTGNLDESFFMYGEDIDLSYRILQEGFNNYYLPKPPIIHYKGESTRKSGINYVINFYRSMIIFARKHYSGKKAEYLLWIINIAIFFRATISILKRAAKMAALPLLDTTILYTGFNLIVIIWEKLRYNNQDYYPDRLLTLVIPLFVTLSLLTLALFGAYRQKIDFRKTIKGVLSASLLIIVVYSVFPSDLRYSRALILLFSALMIILIPLTRFILSKIGMLKIIGLRGRAKRVVIVASEAEYDAILEIIKPDTQITEPPGRISTGSVQELNCIGTIAQIDEIVRIQKPDEIIFSSKDLDTSSIISIIERTQMSDIEKKIACTDAEFVIGSRSQKHAGEVYSFNVTSKK